MSDSELDLYYALPFLSTYLGHQSLEATEKYVRLTDNYFAGELNSQVSLSEYIICTQVSAVDGT